MATTKKTIPADIVNDDAQETSSFETTWKQIPPSVGAQMLWTLSVKQLLAHGARFNDDESYELFAPGELSTVMQSALKLAELDEKRNPLPDPYQVEQLSDADFAEQIIQGLIAWDFLYQKQHGQRLKLAFISDLRQILLGLLTGEGVPTAYLENVPQPKEDDLKKLRKHYTEVQNT